MCVIDNRWLMQEYPGLIPNWFDEIRFLWSKKLNSSLKISLSKILPLIGVMKLDGSLKSIKLKPKKYEVFIMKKW